MSESGVRPHEPYRDEIVGSLTPVRPLPAPSRRTWALVPLGLAVAVTASALTGERGDLDAYTPLLTWGATGVQTLLGLWLLALGFREAVPGRNVSWRALTLASVLAVALVGGLTFLTNAASPTVVRAGHEWQYWSECVAWPLAIGTPFMILATLMAARAFPTRPAVAGALCGTSAGILSDAGWRLSCWISAPAHVVSSHGLAILALAITGSLLAVAADSPRWSRFRSRSQEQLRARDER